MLDFLQIDPVAFTIPIAGGIAVYWYGIIVTFGIYSFWVVPRVTRWRVEQEGQCRQCHRHQPGRCEIDIAPPELLGHDIRIRQHGGRAGNLELVACRSRTGCRKASQRHGSNCKSMSLVDHGNLPQLGVWWGDIFKSAATKTGTRRQGKE